MGLQNQPHLNHDLGRMEPEKKSNMGTEGENKNSALLAEARHVWRQVFLSLDAALLSPDPPTGLTEKVHMQSVGLTC